MEKKQLEAEEILKEITSNISALQGQVFRARNKLAQKQARLEETLRLFKHITGNEDPTLGNWTTETK